MQAQFERQQHLYWLRKRACLDLVEVFSDLHQEDPAVFKSKVGLAEEDFDDKEIQEVLGVFDEEKKGLDGDMADDEENSEDEYDDEDDEDDEDEDDDEEGVHRDPQPGSN